MKWQRYGWTRHMAVIGLAAAVLLLAGCGWLGAGDATKQIDPPQVDYEFATDADIGLAEDLEVMADVLQKEAPVTLYFKDGNGLVAPLSVRIPAEEGIAKLMLANMVDGGPLSDQLPAGFIGLLPQGTKVLAMDIRDGLATVDFSEQFTSYNVQDERKILEAVTWALTGFPTIEQVSIWVEGKPLTEMPKDATPLDQALTRSMGINLEIDEEVNPAQASAVTVYFTGQTMDDYSYYVPVTRLIRYTEDRTSAAMQVLLEGPMAGSGLSSALPGETEVLGVKLQNDTVVVNFASGITDQEDQLKSGAMQAVILSLIEQTGLPKVQIMVNGSAGLPVGSSKEYASPVTRPVQVNPLQS